MKILKRLGKIEKKKCPHFKLSCLAYDKKIPNTKQNNHKNRKNITHQSKNRLPLHCDVGQPNFDKTYLFILLLCYYNL